MNFKGKYVLVTGGSRGIGRAVCQAFARQGAVVAVHYRQGREEAKQTLQSLEGDGHFIVQADISKETDVEKLVKTVTQQFNALDIVVNNAAVFIRHPLVETDFLQWQQAWDDTLGVNLKGPANVCYWAAGYMKEHGGGRIVNISSRGAFRGEPFAPAYGASKAALNAMSQSLAVHLAPHNIFVAVVAPGFVDTARIRPQLQGPRGEEIRNQSPLGRIAKPEEIAQAVLFLSAEGCEFTTGAILDVNGASYLRS